ncbi:hypothetical protein SFB9_6057 [Klebsiella michiganensis]|nr:hypothetical protein SFB9_6057 [Klebsiella michiganensis]
MFYKTLIFFSLLFCRSCTFLRSLTGRFGGIYLFRKRTCFVLFSLAGTGQRTVAYFSLNAIKFGNGLFLVQRLLELFIVLLGFLPRLIKPSDVGIPLPP